MPFYKKLFEKGKMKEKINEILNNYFVANNNVIAKSLVSNISFIKDFIPTYQEFVSNKFIYDKLDYNEKEYIRILEELKDELNISFKESNNQIYNTILFNVICTFEKNNVNVTNYISNFDNIRNDMRKKT